MEVKDIVPLIMGLMLGVVGLMFTFACLKAMWRIIKEI